jgi:ParB/RepB/Spo0J family partition protein
VWDEENHVDLSTGPAFRPIVKPPSLDGGRGLEYRKNIMSLKELNPKECRRWKYADRSSFEMGDLFLLAEDIKQNGQIEPVIVRPIEESGDIKYEVIAGSRRWQACLQHNLPLKVIIHNLNDKEAM